MGFVDHGGFPLLMVHFFFFDIDGLPRFYPVSFFFLQLFVVLPYLSVQNCAFHWSPISRRRGQ